jgi:hypothetical protein
MDSVAGRVPVRCIRGDQVIQLEGVVQLVSHEGRCSECESPAAPGSTFCEPHLRGHALFMVDRARWPRLVLSDGRMVPSGDEAWRPWLRAANGNELSLVLEALKRRGR